ncbi:hypothetical protein [Pelagicoccus mobilis]|uniref:FeoB-associated Cys-rich membrane protein n=1 Tax=Pelagicoccus mobilis TaxID=415221 RepID=A0A934S6Y0_9BACT|nr:hypothetical protein [Pelagicoccus mobilis]MBK1880494.1 hypothetical protein [Pelagicoccus mobilis]
MDSLPELVVVGTIVAAAAAYLVVGYLRKRANKSNESSPCGKGACGCSATKPRRPASR